MQREFVHPDPLIQEVIRIMEELSPNEKQLLHLAAHQRRDSDRVTRDARKLKELKEKCERWAESLEREEKSLELKKDELTAREALLNSRISHAAKMKGFQVKPDRKTFNA